MPLRLVLYYVALCLVLAGLIHVVAVLTLPMLAPKNAWARLSQLGPANTMIALPPASPEQQVMPMMAPDVRYGICRYDVRQGPVRLQAPVPNELWMIAFYTPQGENFYAVAGADMRRPQIDLIIAGEDQPVAEAGVDAPEDLDDAVVVRSPLEEGIVMIRVPLPGSSRAAAAEESLKAASCAVHVAAPAPQQVEVPSSGPPLPIPAPEPPSPAEATP